MSCVWEGDSPALTQLRDSKQQHIDKNNKLTDSWKSVVVKMVIILMVRMGNSHWDNDVDDEEEGGRGDWGGLTGI